MIAFEKRWASLRWLSPRIPFFFFNSNSHSSFWRTSSWPQGDQPDLSYSSRPQILHRGLYYDYNHYRTGSAILEKEHLCCWGITVSIRLNRVSRCLVLTPLHFHRENRMLLMNKKELESWTLEHMLGSNPYLSDVMTCKLLGHGQRGCGFGDLTYDLMLSRAGSDRWLPEQAGYKGTEGCVYCASNHHRACHES